MRSPPEDALFSARPCSTGGVAVRALLLVAALLAGAWLTVPAALLALALAGLAAMVFDGAGRRRLARLLVGAASFVVPAIVVRIATGSLHDALPLLLKLIAGLAWVLWFGGVVSWPALRTAARRCGAPEDALDLVEAGVAHGTLLARELRRRDEAAAVRLGLGRRRDRLADVGAILAGGFERALDRAASLEEARRLRSGCDMIAGASDAALSLHGVVAAYADGTPRLHAITFTLPRARWLAVAGPSGSGKTTLLRLSAGLLPPTAGEILRLGVDLAAAPAAQRLDARAGLVFQDPDDQLFGATPLEDLAWGLRRRGVSEADALERARNMLAALRVEHLAERAIHTLSFGERKRVAFGAVLVCEPELLLCDEPTIGLDPVAARRLVQLVDRIASERRTAVVWVTHDLDALPEPIDRVLLLNGGRIVFDGARAEALERKRLVEAGLALEQAGAGASGGSEVEEKRCSTG